jgi:histidine triad (HIT) family protein
MRRRPGRITGVDCTFCSIIDGTLPSWGVDDDDEAVAFLDIGQATPGHTLVVPRRHAPDLWSLSEDEAAALMRTVHRVAGRLRDTLRPLGLNVLQSNGAAAWQEVDHVHVHLVPRYGDDDLVPPWRSTTSSAEDLAAVQRRIHGS